MTTPRESKAQQIARLGLLINDAEARADSLEPTARAQAVADGLPGYWPVDGPWGDAWAEVDDLYDQLEALIADR